MQVPLQHTWPELQSELLEQVLTFPARAAFASPKQAIAMPARPTPNFFNALRRVTDCARLLVSSSNLLFIFLFWFRDCFYSLRGLVAHAVYHCLTRRKKILVTLSLSTTVKPETKSLPTVARPK